MLCMYSSTRKIGMDQLPSPGRTRAEGKRFYKQPVLVPAAINRLPPPFSRRRRVYTRPALHRALVGRSYLNRTCMHETSGAAA